jgi:hypothetical protein
MHPIAAKLAERIERRPSIEVDLSAVIRDGSVTGTLRLRALTVAEECDATEAAVAFRKRALSALPEKHATAFLEDATFLEDAKYTERLWRACRLADDVSKPAFPSADWMRQHFTVDEMGRLADRFAKAQALNSGNPDTATNEQRWALVEACGSASSSDWPDVVLSGLPRSLVSDLFVWASAELLKLRQQPA